MIFISERIINISEVEALLSSTRLKIELPDILLLSRDANTLLMRQKESENIREKEVV
jgi:hypothetical protein